jgi:hypothetical protein
MTTILAKAGIAALIALGSIPRPSRLRRPRHSGPLSMKFAMIPTVRVSARRSKLCARPGRMECAMPM